MTVKPQTCNMRAVGWVPLRAVYCPGDGEEGGALITSAVDHCAVCLVIVVLTVWLSVTLKLLADATP